MQDGEWINTTDWQSQSVFVLERGFDEVNFEEKRIVDESQSVFVLERGFDKFGDNGLEALMSVLVRLRFGEGF